MRSQFQEVWIPDAVTRELELLPNPDAKAMIEDAVRSGWLRRRTLANPRLAAVLANDLDAGEEEAIVLATEIPADILLIDEKEGRSYARQAGILVRGVLGILIRAKMAADITSAKSSIDELREIGGFFVSPALEEEVLRSVGE